MRILAIDTALTACSAAVLDDTTGEERIVAASIRIDKGHAERLMTMIGEVLADGELGFADLDRIVATIGPGSFTGVRVGLSTARGLGLVLAKPVVGVTTLAAFAQQARAMTPLPIAVAIDARRGEIYGQLFDAGGPASSPTVDSPEALAKYLPKQCALIGSGAQLVADRAGKERDAAILSIDGAPDIAAVARLGARVAVPEAPPAPLYLRAPDAKPQAGAQIERV